MSEENKDALSRDFFTLMQVGRINSFVGWILAIACAVGISVGVVVGIASEVEMFGVALIGLLFLPFSLLVVASGQYISCFVSTERNGKDTTDLLRQILDKMEDKPIQQEEGK